MDLIVIGFGPIAGYKYSRCIHSAYINNVISGYRIIDLESQKENVEKRIAKLPIKPLKCSYIPDSINSNGAHAGIDWLIGEKLLPSDNSGNCKIVVSTEPQSHEAYLKYAIDKGLDVLVTKPLVLPIKEAKIDIPNFFPATNHIIESAEDRKLNSAMLCLGRHHDVYEKKLRQPIHYMMQRLRTPITSIHLKTASGVWNLAQEYFDREDHPYKYGYGMLLHGGYHYIDCFARILLMNKQFFPEEQFLLKISGFKSGPNDQNHRISEQLTSSLSEYNKVFNELNTSIVYGETDVVCSFALCFRSSGRVLCMGTLSLEQTTPGMRSWGQFPEVPYNINGRLHCTDIDVRIGTAFGIAANVTKSPIGARHGEHDLRGVNSGTIVTRSNARLCGTQGFIRHESIERPYGNSFSYSAEAEIFHRWLHDQTTYSDFKSHAASCAILDALLKLGNCDNPENITIDFDYEETNWPESEIHRDAWYHYMTSDKTFSSEFYDV